MYNSSAHQWEGSTVRSEVKVCEVALMLKNVQNFIHTD